MPHHLATHAHIGLLGPRRIRGLTIQRVQPVGRYSKSPTIAGAPAWSKQTSGSSTADLQIPPVGRHSQSLTLPAAAARPVKWPPMLSAKQHLLTALAAELEKLQTGAGARAAFESPKVAAHGDLACTAAMQLAKALKQNPRQLSETLRTALLATPAFERWVDAIVPDWRATGRKWWKSVHRSVGFWMGVVLLLFLLTGMSWTGFWGAKFVQPWGTFPAAKWDAVPTSTQTHAALNTAGLHEVPWGLEQTPLPESGSQAGTPGVAVGEPVNLDGLHALAL
eukprot:gene20014-39599_t